MAARGDVGAAHVHGRLQALGADPPVTFRRGCVTVVFTVAAQSPGHRSEATSSPQSAAPAKH